MSPCDRQEPVEAVISRYKDSVYRLAYSITGNRHDADDVFQEVFLRYITKAPAFSDENHRKAWLLKVTSNCSKKLLTSFWHRRTEPLPENLIFDEVKQYDLYTELSRLEPIYREAVYLYYYEDMPTEAIAGLLSVSDATVRKRLSRAREKLRQFMKEEDYV